MTTIPIPYRIRIGVTGHRQLEHPEAVAKQVRQVLDHRIPELFDKYPKVPLLKKGTKNKTPIQFCVITALAEGADRIVAKEILKMQGSRIEVVLPLCLADYLNDFGDAQSKNEFKTLYKKDSKPTVMRNKSLEKLFSSQDTQKLHEERNQAYLDAGEYVVNHCDVLIAVWDGKKARGKGGTGDIVALARRRGCPLVVISTDSAVLPDQKIRIEKGNGEKDNTIVKKAKEDRKGLSYQEYCRMEIFDSYPIPSKEQRDLESKIIQKWFHPTRNMTFKKNLVDRITERIIPFYVRASIIAQQHQKQYFRAGLLTYILSPLAVAAVVIGVHFSSTIKNLAFLVELVVLLVILLIIISADNKKVHKKWIETRFLSERLRAALYLLPFGLKPTEFIHDPMRRNALQIVGWPVRVLDEILYRFGSVLPQSKMNPIGAKDFIQMKWVQSQIKYHEGKKTTSRRKSRRLEF